MIHLGSINYAEFESLLTEKFIPEIKFIPVEIDPEIN